MFDGKGLFYAFRFSSCSILLGMICDIWDIRIARSLAEFSFLTCQGARPSSMSSLVVKPRFCIWDI